VEVIAVLMLINLLASFLVFGYYHVLLCARIIYRSQVAGNPIGANGVFSNFAKFISGIDAPRFRRPWVFSLLWLIASTAFFAFWTLELPPLDQS